MYQLELHQEFLTVKMASKNVLSYTSGFSPAPKLPPMNEIKQMMEKLKEHVPEVKRLYIIVRPRVRENYVI